MSTAQISTVIQPIAPRGEFRNEPFIDFHDSENVHAMQAALTRVGDMLGHEYELVIGGERSRTASKIESLNPARPATGLTSCISVSDTGLLYQSNRNRQQELKPTGRTDSPPHTRFVALAFRPVPRRCEIKPVVRSGAHRRSLLGESASRRRAEDDEDARALSQKARVPTVVNASLPADVSLPLEASVRRGWRESSKRSSASVGADAPFRGIGLVRGSQG